jgi:hypothetical protein
LLFHINNRYVALSLICQQARLDDFNLSDPNASAGRLEQQLMDVRKAVLDISCRTEGKCFSTSQVMTRNLLL